MSASDVIEQLFANKEILVTQDASGTAYHPIPQGVTPLDMYNAFDPRVRATHTFAGFLPVAAEIGLAVPTPIAGYTQSNFTF